MHGTIEPQYIFRFNLHHKYIFITPQIQIIYILRNYCTYICTNRKCYERHSKLHRWDRNHQKRVQKQFIFYCYSLLS